MKTERIIIGIDPGTVIMGYGVISVRGQEVKMLEMGVLKLSKYTDYALKLQKIFERTLSLIEQYHPDEMAVEAPFFGKNVQSMLKLGRAQGVAMAAALHRSVPICEYSPRKVKMAITGSGNASKEQVAAMLQTLLSFKETPQYLDATDGLAVAVCHAFQKVNRTAAGTSFTGWKAFLQENPTRKI